MKRIIFITLSLALSCSVFADDRPVTYAQLPAAAQAFITANFPDDKISYATKDDDIIFPEYSVVLVNGVRMQFCNSGALEKIESRIDGVPENLVPVQILDYVKAHYPESMIVEYETGRRHHEVKLSNRLELKFNRNFTLIGIDD